MAKVRQTKYIREVCVKYNSSKVVAESVNSPSHIANFLRTVQLTNAKEHFYVVFLNGNNRIVGYSLVSVGTQNQCQISPREVFQPALLAGAVSIIVAHNHPSGNLTPSLEDKAMTKRLSDAATLLDIKLLDHVIFSDESFVSLRETDSHIF